MTKKEEKSAIDEKGKERDRGERGEREGRGGGGGRPEYACLLQEGRARGSVGPSHQVVAAACIKKKEALSYECMRPQATSV
jgi:hypothetical protein